jgi:ribosomal protein L22
VQILNYLSAAKDAADLSKRIQDERTQYGYADVLSQVTGGALTDATRPSSDSDVTGTTGNFQSILKTAIDNATKNQDLDTQNLQSLTTQIQSNNSAMTQLIQSFEQLLRSLAQNF